MVRFISPIVESGNRVREGKGFSIGELKAVELLPNIQIIQYGTPEFVNKKQPLPIDFQEAEAALEYFITELRSNKWDIIILDEVNVALDYKLISEEIVLKELKTKPKNLINMGIPRFFTVPYPEQTKSDSSREIFHQEFLNLGPHQFPVLRIPVRFT